MASSARGRVIVVGSSNTDLVVHCDKLPGAGETVLGGDMLTFAGGKGANQAVAAARAGAKVHFIGAFGDDAFGKARRADLEREGIDCTGCVVKKGAPSGVALIAIGKSAKGSKAENLIVVAPGANARLTPADVKRGMPRNLDLDDVVLCSMEVPDVAIAEAFRGRRAQNILNPAPFPASGLTYSILRNTGVIIPNESEFEMLSGKPAGTPKSREFLLKLMKKFGISRVVLTMGKAGAAQHFIYRKHNQAAWEKADKRKVQGVTFTHDFPPGPDFLGTNRIRAPKVRAVDTVGAGDCFCGTFAAKLAEESLEFEFAVPFAVTAASLKVTRHGAQAGMPYRHEILKMMKKLPRS